MAQYAAGRREAFDELFRRYATLVLGYMRRGYVTDADAHDLTQQTFLQLHRARRDYRPEQPLRPWLMTIARNAKRDFFRRQRRREPLESLPEELGRVDRRVERSDVREEIARSIERLPPALATIVRARWFEHRTYQEIADLLGISPGAAKVRAHRACRALRTILTAESFEDGSSRQSRNPRSPPSVDPTSA
ncbi:MAG: RNA polymerase sigma factor [Planctomycetota bacterium]